MPQPLPDLPASASSPQRRRAWLGWSQRVTQSDNRSVQIAVVVTVFVHVALLVFAPQIERLLSSDSSTTTADEWASQEFQVEFAPAATLPEPAAVQLPRFVEANPNVPDNLPDETDLVAAQNQQVAQPTATPEGETDLPASKGNPSVASTAVVSGQSAESRPVVLVRETSPPAPTPAQQPLVKPTQTESEPAESEVARRAQTPLPGADKFEGESATGFAANIAPVAPNASAVPEHVEGQADAKSDTGSRIGLYYKVDAKRPQARPTLAPNLARARATPLADRKLGTENIGAVAYDAKWSSYGEYLQKLIETVQVQWQRILDQSNVYPQPGTKVTVVFRLNDQGAISEIVKVSDGGRGAQDACVSAIVARAPYGAWTADMIGILGNSQEITFTFFYN